MVIQRVLAFALTSLCGCSTALDLGSNDAGVPYDADCRPGTYAGNFACIPTDSSVIQFSTQGAIAVTLVPIGARTLALPPDASLIISTSGTTTTSLLSGTLDCATRALKGGYGPVEFTSTTFSGTVLGTGVFSATYDPDASPPALIDGVMQPPPSLAAKCTWSAQLK
jgi:hypothetical protein